MESFHLILEILVLGAIILIFLLIYYLVQRIFSQKEINLAPFLEMIDVYSPVLTVFRDREGKIVQDPQLEAKWATGLKQRSFTINEVLESGGLKRVSDLRDEKGAIHYDFILPHPKRTLQITSIPINDASSKFYGVIDFVLDVSFQRKIENESLGLSKILDFYNNVLNDLMTGDFQEKNFNQLADRMSILFDCDFIHFWSLKQLSTKNLDFLPLTLCKPFSIHIKKTEPHAELFNEWVQEVILTHKPLFVERSLGEGIAVPFQWLGNRRNIWIVPVIALDADLIGVIVMANLADQSSFNKANASLVSSLIALVILFTENKRREELSCLSKHDELERLANLMDNLPGVIFTCQKRPLWQMTFLSQGISELSGYSVEELVGVKGAFERMIHAEDRANIARLIDVGLARTNSFQLIFRIITKNNVVKWVWARGKSKGFNSYGVMLLEGMLIDITQQVEADKLAQEQQLFINKMVEALPFSINVVNKDGYIQNSHVLSGENHKHIFADQYAGMHLNEIVDDKSINNVEHAIKQVIDNGGVIDVEARIFPLEPPRWFESRMVKIGTDEALVFSRDITERKQTDAKVLESELLFRSLFDMGNIALGIINRDGTFSQINSKFAQLLDLQLDVGDLHWSQIIIPEESDYDSFIFLKLERGELQSYHSEKKLVKSDGSIVYTHFTLFLLKNEYLQSFKFIVSFIDISDRMNLERQVLSTMIDTEEKERMRMARDLHDGVGPLLSSLKMYFQWMQMKDSKANKEELMNDAQVLIDQTLQTIRDISFNLSPHLLQNYGLVVGLESFIGKVSGGNNPAFQFNANGMKERLGEENEVIMYRALTECINNTLKYANAKNVNIDFALQDNLFCAIYKDDGIGFDAEKVLARKTGMGLFNMQSRLKAVNGKVRFKSSEGNGCHIELEITI